MENIYQRPQSMTGTPFNYWPVKDHEEVFHVVGELADELHIREKLIGVTGVGASIFMSEYFNFDFVSASSGRAPSVALGLKTVNPDSVIFTYQGYQDLCLQGLGDMLHRAASACPLTAIFVNNGLTRAEESEFYLGSPARALAKRPVAADRLVRVSELVASSRGATFVARVILDGERSVATLKGYLKSAFERQIQREGFSFVEVVLVQELLAGLSEAAARKKLKKEIEPLFPPSVLVK